MSQQINLYNPLFRKRGFSFTSAAAMLYGVGIALAVAALAAVYEDYRAREVAREAHVVDSALKQAQARRDKLIAEQAARKPDPQLQSEIAVLNAQLKGRQEVIDALKSGAVGTDSGFSEYLRAFSRQSVNGLWLTGFDIAAGGNELSISGRTLSPELVPSYLERLNQEKPMRGRQFAALRIHQPVAAHEPAKAADKDGKGQPARPRYLEFTISTGDLAPGADKQSAERTPQRLSLKARNSASSPDGTGPARAEPDVRAAR